MWQKHGKGKGIQAYCCWIGKKQSVESRGKGRGGVSGFPKHGNDDSRAKFGTEKASVASSFEDLPEECISNIISLTSPRDACVAALVSKTFKSAVDSDAMWEKFLPPDYASLIPGSRVFSSKKELYFALCDHFLIEDGSKSFWLEKASGKKCIMLSALDLAVGYEEDASLIHSLEYWKWYPIPESRFERVGEIVTTFEIHGSTYSSILSPETLYSAYVVFKKLDHFRGFEDCTIQAYILMGTFVSRRLVCFDPVTDENFEGYNGRLKPKQREDEWMELELGEFFNEAGGDDEIIVTASQYKSNFRWIEGLVIEGIEIRPTENQQSFFSLEG
ncbi:F-box protein PP2-B10-like [Eutrema salsugineum]|uniref:F-box protein PP2-B10-like n=1 Tax=Eutrema salsugineum TaxID=72664 RepID=UPI000CED6234|nr:F-box protein PP2-B10-like [Eutrema salsugineum]